MTDLDNNSDLRKINVIYNMPYKRDSKTGAD